MAKKRHTTHKIQDVEKEVGARHAAYDKASEKVPSETIESKKNREDLLQSLEKIVVSKGKKFPKREGKGPLGAESDEHFLKRMAATIKRNRDNPTAAEMYERVMIKELQRRGRSESEAKAELMHRMIGL